MQEGSLSSTPSPAFIVCRVKTTFSWILFESCPAHGVRAWHLPCPCSSYTPDLLLSWAAGCPLGLEHFPLLPSQAHFKVRHLPVGAFFSMHFFSGWNPPPGPSPEDLGGTVKPSAFPQLLEPRTNRPGDKLQSCHLPWTALRKGTGCTSFSVYPAPWAELSTERTLINICCLKTVF